MMEQIREYILSVVSVAILCGILAALAGKKSAAAPVLKLVCGIVLSMTVIQPLAHLKWKNLSAYSEDLTAQAEAAAAMGGDLYMDSRRQVIIRQTQAYILDKAREMDLELTASIHLNSEDVPEEAVLTGKPTFLQKQQMQEILETDLGIPKERQIWID